MNFLTLVKVAAIVGGSVWGYFVVSKWIWYAELMGRQGKLGGLIGAAQEMTQTYLILQSVVVGLLFLFGFFFPNRTLSDDFTQNFSQMNSSNKRLEGDLSTTHFASDQPQNMKAKEIISNQHKNNSSNEMTHADSSPQNLITRCSRCDIKYFVSVGQLNEYAGVVRCGGCNEIFDAHTNLESDLPVLTSSFVNMDKTE